VNRTDEDAPGGIDNWRTPHKSLRETLREIWDSRGMSRADRKAWKSARTLGDLGELVIRWLNGEIRQTPGHLGPPCDETIPLIGALTVINRGGFITDNSQLADSRDGEAWSTDVEGFATDAVLKVLREAVAGTPLILAACRRTAHECDRVADLWWHCPWRETASFWAQGCPALADELEACWYVAVIDPEPGRNDLLWNTLIRAFTGQPA
jgi:hypothetical protein